MVMYATARNVGIFRYISFVSKSALEPLTAAFDFEYKSHAVFPYTSFLGNTQ